MSKHFNYIFLVLALLLTFNSFSQNTIQGSALYEHKVRSLSSNAILYFSSERSSYILNKTGLDTLEKEEVTLENIGTKIFHGPTDAYGEIYAKDLSKNTLQVRNLVFKTPVIYEEPLPKIAWILADSTKKIGRFNCQQAKATFRGRNYTAWFTNEIPIQIGPWKFSGLPGLIVAISDDKNFVSFTLRSINIPQEVSKALNFPIKTGKKVSFDEHKNGYPTILEAINNMANAKIDDSDSKIVIQIPTKHQIEQSFNDE